MCHRQIKITTYDRLLRAWENSMEAVRDFQSYADLTEDNDKAKQAFYDFAENSAKQAAKLRNLLLEYKKSNALKYQTKRNLRLHKGVHHLTGCSTSLCNLFCF